MLDLAMTHLAGDPDCEHLLVVGPSAGVTVEALWTDCAAHLGDHYQVVGWDLPGHGRSPAARAAFTIPDLAAEITRAAATCSRGRRCWYAGVCVGAAVGFELAIKLAPFGAIAALASAPEVDDPVQPTCTSVVATPFVRHPFAPTVARTHPGGAEILTGEQRRVDPQSRSWACEALASFDHRLVLDQAKVPMLLAAGVLDGVFPPASAREAVGALHVEYRVPNGRGYLTPAEQPMRVARMLHEFFDRQTRPRRFQRWFGELHSVMAARQ